MSTLRHALVTLLAIAAFWTAAPSARAGELDAAQRMKILMRVLTYDRQLESRQDEGKIVVAVLYSARDAASVKEKTQVLAALGALKALKIKGLSLDFVEVAYTGVDSVKNDLGGRRAAALYVCRGLASATAAIQRFAATSKIATMSGSEELTRGGLAFAAVEKGGKGEIVVNLKVAKGQGLDLDAALLSLAVVLR
jgi:hypothetical protein